MHIFVYILLIASILYFVFLEKMAKRKDIYKPSVFNIIQKKDYNILLDEIVDMIMHTDKRPDFYNLLRQIESGNNPNAKNPKSSAKGVYQFTDDTVVTTKNQGKNLGFNKKYIRNIPNNPQEWSDDQADIMTSIKLFASEVPEGSETYYGLKGRKGLVDSLLTEAVGNDDVTSMKDLYYTKWLTGEPGSKTKFNVERHMAPYAAEKTKDTLIDYLKGLFGW